MQLRETNMHVEHHTDHKRMNSKTPQGVPYELPDAIMRRLGWKGLVEVAGWIALFVALWSAMH